MPVLRVSGATAGRLLRAVSLGMLLSACGGAPGDTAPDDNVLHAVMTADIQRHNDRLAALFFDQHRTETEIAALRQRNREAIITAARALELSATQLETLTPARLQAEDVGQYRTLADEMGERAAEIAIHARNAEFDALEAALGLLNQTCHSCHALYRTP